MIEPPRATVAQPLEALRGECEALSGVVLALTEEDFARAVPRTPAWTVKELLGHVHRGMARICRQR